MFESEELLNEFCRVQDREFGCKEAFACLQPECICPLRLALLVASTHPKDRADVAAHTESMLRAPLGEDAKVRVLGDRYLHPNRQYPRARILCEIEEYLLHHVVPDSAILYWKEGEIKRIDQWKTQV